MNISDRIRAVRSALGLTQRALADLLAVPQSYISEVENMGSRSSGMSVRQVERFAAALSVPVAVLIDAAAFDEHHGRQAAASIAVQVVGA